MSNQQGTSIPGAEAYVPFDRQPMMQASIATGNAGGAAVAAQYLSLASLGHGIWFDFRIIHARGDRAFTGTLTFKILLNGAPVNSGALAPANGLAFVVGAQVNPWEADSPNNPGVCTIDHGDKIGWTVQASSDFTCTGTMTITLQLIGASHEETSFKAHSP